MAKSDKLYSDSPSIKKDKEGKTAVKRPSQAEPADQSQAGATPGVEDPADTTSPDIHQSERREVHNKHAKEAMDMHHRHEMEHQVHKGDKKELHKKHLEEHEAMHRRQEQEMAEMQSRQEANPAVGGGEGQEQGQ
jgi:hypothetical protein